MEIRHSKRVWLATLVIFGFAVCLVLLFRPRYPITIHDNRFEVLALEHSFGTNHVLFHGNPFVARARALLKKFGIPCTTIPKYQHETWKPVHAFGMRYKSQLQNAHYWQIQADFVDQNGIASPIYKPVAPHYLSRGECVTFWLVPTALSGNTNFTLRLRHESNVLARIKIGKLKRPN